MIEEVILDIENSDYMKQSKYNEVLDRREELLEELSKSRLQHKNGMSKSAESVLADMRTKYEL